MPLIGSATLSLIQIGYGRQIRRRLTRHFAVIGYTTNASTATMKIHKKRTRVGYSLRKSFKRDEGKTISVDCDPVGGQEHERKVRWSADRS